MDTDAADPTGGARIFRGRWKIGQNANGRRLANLRPSAQQRMFRILRIAAGLDGLRHLTVTCVLPAILDVFSVAVIVAVPAAFAVTLPVVSTSAQAGSELSQSKAALARGL